MSTMARTTAKAGTTRAPAVHPQPVLQAKLRIGPIDDPLEREADRVADAVVSGTPIGAVGDAPSGGAQRQCAACKADEEKSLQRKESSSARFSQGAADAAAAAVSSGGAPLSAEQRAYFEPRFGHDFSHVRLHMNAEAARAAAAINARAYTLGSDIAFAAAHVDSSREPGRRLMAHELTHVVQQRGSASTATLQREEPEQPTESMYFSAGVPGILDCELEDVVDDPATSCCGSHALSKLPGMYATAIAYTDRAIGRMAEGKRMDVAVGAHFGSDGMSNISTILTNLRTIRTELGNPGGRHVHRCRADFDVMAQFRQPLNESTRELYCEYGLVASASPDPDTPWVTFCLDLRGEIDGGWAALLHEIVHVARIGDLPDRGEATPDELASGEFETYAWERKGGNYPNKGGFALRNADSYAKLIEDIGAESWTEDTRRERRQERRRLRRERRAERRRERQ